MDNYFIAIPIAEDKKLEVEEIASKLREKLPNLRWVRPELFHITLKFIGKKGREYALKEFERFKPDINSLECKGPGMFYYDKAKENPRVLFLKYSDNKRNEYHLTLARAGRNENSEKIITTIQETENNILFGNLSFRAEKAVLMHSKIEDKLVYETVAERILK